MNPHTSRTHSFFAAGIAALLLVACNAKTTTPAVSKPVPELENTKSIVSIYIDSTNTPQQIAQQFNAEVLTWHPEDHFAHLLVDQPSSGLSAQATTTSTDSPIATDVTASGTEAWASGVGVIADGMKLWSGGVKMWSGGVKMWSGGIKMWSGGIKMWSGGMKMWSGGNVSTADEFDSEFAVAADSAPKIPKENLEVFKQIRLPSAFSMSRYFGGGVKVAIIDTGIDLTHESLAYNLVDKSEWKDYVDGDALPQETVGTAYGHGTAVAGLILQVAPSAGILPIRVLNGDGRGSISHVIKAIDYAVSKNAQIINLSLGAIDNNYAMQQICAYARSKGVLLVGSVGNNGRATINFPARYSYYSDMTGGVFGVGSVSANDTISSFSNYGGDIFGWAPGEKLTTLYPMNGTAPRTAQVSGTSFAAHLVSGALALALGDTNKGTAAAAAALTAGMDAFAENTLTVQGQSYQGKGRLDVERMMRSIQGWKVPSKILPTVELVPDGSFESGKATGWTLSNTTVVNDRYNAAYRGLYGLSINATGGSATLKVPVKKDVTYSVTAMVKLRDATDQGKITLSQSGVALASTSQGQTAQWLKKSFMVKSTADGTLDMVFSKTAGYGVMRVDLISVVAQ